MSKWLLLMLLACGGYQASQKPCIKGGVDLRTVTASTTVSSAAREVARGVISSRLINDDRVLMYIEPTSNSSVSINRKADVLGDRYYMINFKYRW